MECYATPAEGLSGKFIKKDQKMFGIIKGVTDKEYYTNSYHIPVKFPISIKKKIDIKHLIISFAMQVIFHILK